MLKKYKWASASWFLVLLLSAPASFPCHGIMKWRFLPIEEARRQVARLEAEAKIKAPMSLTIIPPEPGKWYKFFNNPIFKPGPPGSWEEKSVDCHSIMYFRDKFMMWYVGTPQNLSCQIGLATSVDGINWTRCQENPVLRLGPKGSWDESIIICQSVLFDRQENIFKMWYVGGNPQGVFGIGYATSADGIHWIKYGQNPVLTVTEPWEGHVLESQTVLKMPDGYKMWYGGYNLQTDQASIGLATSADGINWTKHAQNPIFKPGSPKTWESYSVENPDVHYFEGIYHMWYKGWRKKDGISWIGHASSSDGVNWERDPLNPILLTTPDGNAWDSFQLYRPRVLLDDGHPQGPARLVHRMWFAGRTFSLDAQIGLAYQIEFNERERKIRKRLLNVNQDNIQLEIESISKDSIEIYYFTPWLSQIQATIYNSSGEKIRTLVKEVQLPGFYQIAWDGRDEKGNPVLPGLYFCELLADKALITKEIVLKK